MKKTFLLLVTLTLAMLSASAAVNYTNTVPNLRVLTNAIVDGTANVGTLNAAGSGRSRFTNGLELLNVPTNRLLMTAADHSVTNADSSTSSFSAWTNAATVFSGEANKYIGADGLPHVFPSTNTLGANWSPNGSFDSDLNGIATVVQINASNSLQGIITVSNQMGFQGIAAASLPTGVAAGYQTYCTDALTPWGVGDRVEWDGSVWRNLRSRVATTADLTTFVFNCVAAAVNIQTPRSDVGFSSWVIGQAAGAFSRQFSGIGTSSGGAATTIASGAVQTLATGTTTTGSMRAMGPLFPAMVAGDTYCTGMAASVSNFADGTDNFWSLHGFITANGAGFPTTGAFFLYDKYNATGHNQSYTNNWICVTANSSSYTYADSGLAVTAGTSVVPKLGIIANTTGVTFYTNQVACASISTTVPAAQLFSACSLIVKTSGTASRSENEMFPWFHVRRNADRSY